MQNIYMEPPAEWYRQFPELAHCMWHMKKSIYGRRCAGANSRDYYHEVAPKAAGRVVKASVIAVPYTLM